MEIRKVPISLLNAAPYNPRKDLQPGDPEYQKIARSIEKYGCVEPIIWNEKTGNVIGGHQRLKVLAATGAVEVDVSVVQLSLEDEKALNLALNKISGQWDNEKLSAVLQDLSVGFDVEVTGFDQHEVDALVASFAESGHEYELPGSEPYINNFFDSGVQAKPKAEEPAAVPAPEAPAQDAEMHPSAAPAPNEVQAVQPGVFPATDAVMDNAYQTLLGQNWIFVIGSLSAYLVSQSWDVAVFHAIRDRYIAKHGSTKGGRWLWNNGSTITSQIWDTVIYAVISFGFGLGWVHTHEGRMQLIGIIIGQYLLKACLALLDTPFFYFFTRNADRR